MKSRRASRQTALQALYQCDALNDWSAATVDLFFASFADEEREVSDDAADSEAVFVRRLIDGVRDNAVALDEAIKSASVNWSVERMARVDRNILRLAAFEIKFCPDIPVRVSINEAIELAKVFGSSESPLFVNGVLDKVASLADKGESPDSLSADEPPRKIAV